MTTTTTKKADAKKGDNGHYETPELAGESELQAALVHRVGEDAPAAVPGASFDHRVQDASGNWSDKKND